MCKKEYTIEIVVSKNNIYNIIPTSIKIKTTQKIYKNITINIITLRCNYINIIKILLAFKHHRIFIHKVMYYNNGKVNIIIYNALKYIIDDTDSNDQNDPSLLDYTSSDNETKVP